MRSLLANPREESVLADYLEEKLVQESYSKVRKYDNIQVVTERPKVLSLKPISSKK